MKLSFLNGGIITLVFLMMVVLPVNSQKQQPKAIEIKEGTLKEKSTTPVKPKPKPVAPLQQKNTTPKPAPTTTTPPPAQVATPAPTPAPVVQPTTPAATAPKPEPFDTVVKMGGKRIPVTGVRIGANDVNYTTLDGKAVQLRRKDIEKILYKNGKIEVFNKPVFQEVKETSWEAIYVTDNPAEIDGMFEIDKIRASASSNQRSMKDAKQSATIRLQKKAAQMGAIAVLVTKRESKGGYGEVPGYDIEGVAYSSEPKPKPQKK